MEAIRLQITLILENKIFLDSEGLQSNENNLTQFKISDKLMDYFYELYRCTFVIGKSKLFYEVEYGFGYISGNYI